MTGMPARGSEGKRTIAYLTLQRFRKQDNGGATYTEAQGLANCASPGILWPHYQPPMPANWFW